MSQYTKNATDQQIGQITSAPGVSVVDFWAEWCGPCKALGPHVDALAEEFQGRATVYKLNVDENPGASAAFRIRGIPTVLIFKDGKVVDQIVGSVSREALRGAIERQVESGAG